jgi:iduronate 2-sulfatase
LVIRYPTVKNQGAKSDAVVETLDIFPTLCELADLPAPKFAQGSSLVPQLEDPEAEGRDAYAYRGGAKTVRTKTHRLVLHSKGEVELYDHRTIAGEANNIANTNPELVSQLKAKLAERFARK